MVTSCCVRDPLIDKTPGRPGFLVDWVLENRPIRLTRSRRDHHRRELGTPLARAHTSCAAQPGSARTCPAGRAKTRLLRAPLHGIDPERITYYFRRVMVVAEGSVPGMAVWRERLFAAMHLDANLPAAYFGVAPAEVVEVGLEVEI
jgi:hypothetical protein